MRNKAAFSVCVLLLSASAALADSRVFIIANHPDGYGIDECLANGEKCGAAAARAYCQSREFAQASGFRRIDPSEVTGTVPTSTPATFSSKGDEYVAITCHR